MRSNVNRAQRRKRLTPPSDVADYVRNYRCPDCLSETAEPFSTTNGVWHLVVRHDATCPTYTAMNGDNL